MYKKALIILLLTLNMSAWAHLQGVVLDENGQPLVGANVYWAETNEGAASDENGMFEVEPVRKTKQLVTSYLGYRNDTLLVQSRDFITIVLTPEDELAEVEVVERRKDVVRARYSAFDVQTLGKGELCRAACCNLSESFETNASVDVAYTDAGTGMHQIRMLGLSGTYVQVLGENSPAVRGLVGSYGMDYVPGPWIESVQISKGTASVRNGYEAITGQINFEFLKPQTQNPLDISFNITDEFHVELDAMGGWDIPIPKDPMMGTLSTSVMAHYHNGTFTKDEDGDGFLDIPQDQSLNLLNRWYYKNDGYSFQWLMRGMHDDRHSGQRPSWNHPRQMPQDPYLIELQADRVEAMMKHGIMLDKESGMSIGIVSNASFHRQHNLYGPRLWHAEQVNAYTNAIWQNNWEGGGNKDNDHQLAVGASVNYDRYDERICFDTLLLREGQGRDSWLTNEVTAGVFAEYTFKLEDQLSMVAGVRADYSTRYGWFMTPRLNIRYAPWEWWTIRGSVGLGYRSPLAVADYAQYLPTNRTWVMTDLKQEQSLNAGVTMSWDIPLGSRSMQLTAEYYYTRFLNGVVADQDSSRYSITFFNLSDVPGACAYSHNAQIEATMEILKGWTMTLAFRYNDVKQTTYNAVAGEYQLREKVLQNRFKGLITTSYVTPKGGWQFDVTAQFNGPGRLYDGFKIPDGNKQYYEKDGAVYHTWYPQLMAQVTKYFKHNVSLYFGTANMTNFVQQNCILGDVVPAGAQGAGLIDSHSKDFDATTIWAPTTGWSLYLGLRWAMDKK